MKKMKQRVFNLIKTDLELRKKISDVHNVSDNSIKLLAVRKSPKLTEYNILNVIKEHTKLTDEQIFENVK
jgi:hypothetical protein